MSGYINIHTHAPQGCFAIVDLNRRYTGNDFERESLKTDLPLRYSAGIHPYAVEQQGMEGLRQTDLPALERVLGWEEVSAVGECGLDRRYTTSFEQQKNIFRDQLALADKYGKPLIIHCVKAHSELIALYKENRSKLPLIIHGFNNNIQILDQLLKHGFYISLGAALLHPDSHAAQLIGEVPVDRLFFESDDKEMNISEVYDAAANLLRMDLTVLKEHVRKNAALLFPLIPFFKSEKIS